MRSFAAKLLALGLVLAPLGTSAQTAPATIHVGVIPAEASAEAFYALDRGFFKKQGLNVDLQIMQNGAAIAAAVMGGSLDAGFSDTVSISNAYARGMPLLYLAPALLNTYAAPTIAILVSATGPIHKAKDLNGKTIAVNGINNVTMLPVEAWIDQNGGDSKTIKWVEFPIPQENEAVLSGKVDATVTGEPFITFGTDKGLRALYMDKNSIAARYVLCGYFTTKDWATTNPVLAEKFIAAIKETAQWANANPVAAGVILAKYTKLPQAVVDRMKHGQFAETLLVSDYQPVIDVAARYGVLPKPFPASEYFYR